MFYVLQNESTAALRRVPILLTDAATGTTAQTGVATTNIFPYVNINGGAFASGAGTVGEAGYGQYYYEMDSTEIGVLGLAGVHITAVGCRDYDAIAQIAAFNVYSAAAGATAFAVAQAVWDYDPALYNPTTSGEYLAQTRTEAYAASNNTNDISGQVWNTDVSSYTSPSAGYDLTQAAAGGGITAGDVWDYVGGRTITGGIADTVTLVTSPVDISYPSMAGLANTIWSTDISAYVSPSAGYDLTQAALGGSGLTAGDVWSYATRTITGGIADTVTNVTNGVIVTTNNDKTGYALSGTQSFNLTGNITGNLSGSVGSVTADVNVSTTSMTGIAGTVWSYVTRTLTSGGGITAGDVSNAVWNAPVASYSTNGTFGKNVLRADQANKVGDVTLYSSGGVNGVDADVHRIANDTAAATSLKNILTGVSGETVTANLTGNVTGNLSGSVGSVTSPVSVATTSMTGIAGTVWNYVTRTLTSGGSGLTAGDVWDYAGGRTITGGTITTVSDKTGYSLSGTQSFNLTGNITGNLSGSVGSVSGAVGSVTGSVGSVTGSVGSVVSAVSLSTATQASIANSVWLTDVTSYAAPSAGEDLATAAVGGISPADVWTYATRTITGGIADTVTTLTNKSGFAITGGTIDVVNDKTGYSLSGTQTFNVTGNITGNVTGSVGSVSGAVGSVTGNVGGNVVGSVASVTNPVSIATASMTGIAGTVWTYGTRTLTSGAGISAGDVWTYDISGITTSGSAGNALNDAAVSGSVVTIVNGPYRLNSTAEGTDGRIDILQGSIQTINLNLVNGFDQPFNVTGYSLSVDIYDVSSALVESYVPTVNFASGGNISFDIDGTVTDIIGTYTLVVSLTNGDVVQVGPITILVRPL